MKGGAVIETLGTVTMAALDKTGTNDQHEVVRRRQRLEPLTPELAQLALDLRADYRASGPLRHRDPEPRLVAFVSREPVEDEEPRRGRLPVPIHGVEVPGAGEAVPTMQFWGQAESRLRPRALRRFRIARPARVDIRALNPCFRFLRRTFG